MVGLHTGNFQLILPRVDDCLSLLMGSMEQRYAALQGGFGIFLTESWLSSSGAWRMSWSASGGSIPQAGGDDHPADVPEF